MSAERRRLTLALLLSLLIHTLLSSLILGGQGLGLPGFGFPWQERRIEVPDLNIVLAPAPTTTAVLAGVSMTDPLRQASIEQPVASRPALTPPVPLLPAPGPTAEAPASEPAWAAPTEPTPEARPEPGTATVAAPAQVRWRTEAAGEAPPTPAPEPIVIAAGRSGEAKLVLPAMPSMPTPVIAAAPSASSPLAEAPAPREAGAAAQKRLDAQALEAQRQEAALAAARIETARQEAGRQQAARQESARQETARQEAARAKVAQEEEARLERRRAMGRQLDEEAARREAAAAAAGPPTRLAPAPSSARRGRLFGRTDSNAELILYAEAWARKIQLNMTIDLVRDAAKRPHTQPLVTVAIRSDGSVESVTFVVSSGVAEIDEAIRRIVQSQMPYPAFAPALASEFDVIEIRRTWHFDMAVRLY